MPEIRPFARHDRDQLTDLVNAHIKAIVPGCSVPVATLLSPDGARPGRVHRRPMGHRTRDVGRRSKPIDWWRRRICTATATNRPSARRCGTPAEVNWLVCWPANLDAGRRVDARRRCSASIGWVPSPPISTCHCRPRSPTGSTMPGRISRRWPATPDSPTLTDVRKCSSCSAIDRIAAPGEPPIDGLRSSPTAARRSALHSPQWWASAEIGLLEIDDDFTRHGSMLRNDGWADISNMQVAEGFRRLGVATLVLASCCRVAAARRQRAT